MSAWLLFHLGYVLRTQRETGDVSSAANESDSR